MGTYFETFHYLCVNLFYKFSLLNYDLIYKQWKTIHKFLFWNFLIFLMTYNASEAEVCVIFFKQIVNLFYKSFYVENFFVVNLFHCCRFKKNILSYSAVFFGVIIYFLNFYLFIKKKIV